VGGHAPGRPEVHHVSVEPRSDQTLSVALHGDIEAPHAEQILSEIRAAIDQFLPRAVRVDLSDVTFIDTAGMGTLVGAMSAAHKVGAEYAVTDASDIAQARLRMIGLAGPLGMAEEGGPP
jgi:anti-sigma B factor antagonist